MFYTVHPSHMLRETRFAGVKKCLPLPACPAVCHPLCWEKGLGALTTNLTPIVNMLRRGLPCIQPTSIRRPARDGTASAWGGGARVLAKAKTFSLVLWVSCSSLKPPLTSLLAYLCGRTFWSNSRKASISAFFSPWKMPLFSFNPNKNVPKLPPPKLI